ncbi:MAG: protein kinase, partial [Deltaproteobacteria bacterium]|nr:protein kinase [Deltaproteobacteria bacterium]
MRPGDVLEERYRLDVVAGRGGGGTVVRALDLASGQTVAIKLMRGVDAHQVARFSREVAVLASLGAPGIVRFLGSGNTPSGMPYLVMEWVEGESLAARLSRGRLSVEETLAVARAVAAALAVAHAHGVVHRDVKPSNVLLERGDAARPKLLDFGIARRTDAVHDLTDTGQVVGTYAYMAPEQAWARHRLGPPADVFALGCVLFECLTGRKAFRATDGRAVLAKVLLEDPPRVRELRADVPPALDRLVGRMLAKDPSLRPSDGAAMVSEIDALSVERPSTRADGEEEETTSLTTSERRVFVVVVARAGLEVPVVLDEPGETDATLVSDEVELLSALGACGARAEVLADGSVVAVPVAPGMPTDQAVRAARCALTLRERLPAAPIAIATGLGETTGGAVPTGDVIERAFAAVGETRKGEIVVDVTTASLLGSRFDVRPRDAVLVLVGEATGLEGRRLVLGRVTPFVGRERELAVVAATWLECVEEPAARAFVVVGSAGTGKTRLQQEIVERLGAASAGAIEVLLGRGDPIRDGAPFGVAGDLLRRACAVLDGEPIDDRRTKLLGRVRALLGDAPDAESTAWFLGEIAAVPFDSAGRELLRSARADAMLMADLTSHAWVRWLGALTDATPVLLVLEDLHWGDEPSLRLVGAALRQLERRALLVLAMTRPETPRGTEQLLRAPGATELRLPRLGPRAATALVREVLGDLSDLEVSRIVKQADGHPFYLEELLRERATAPAAAPPGGAPTSVLAMLHARLAALPEEQRRVLRVGSVYGGRFWRDAVAALVRSTSLDVDLDALVRAELVSP